ncbi:MAG: transketolase [Candidatus Omnitrophica bacterium]|nr:transketolase [Candidatus Omnitrophota bacterium]
MEKNNDIKQLKRKAIEIRRDTLTMLSKAGSGHTGGSLSIVEILIALYYGKMNISCKNFRCRDRDKFILSKGHGCPALYAVLADLKFFPKKELWSLRTMNSRLQGHPQLGLPGLEISSGSLGQGLSVAEGIALADKMDGINARVYCLMGDGETNEGQVWEAAMTAAHYKLDNICGIIDHNKLQIDGHCCEIMDLGEYRKKWENFGWHVIETDGHDIEALRKAIDDASEIKGKPQIIIAHTVKGKGVSFIENRAEWHGIAPNEDELKKAFEELDKAEKELER